MKVYESHCQIVRLLTILFFIFPSVSSMGGIDHPSAEQASVQNGGIDDRDIAFAIRAEFQVERTVPSDGIAVKVEDGIVTLEGSVHTLLAKDRAVSIVETIRGARGILNRIVVEPEEDLAGLTDEEIVRRVRRALRSDPATRDLDIRISSADQSVTLFGEVESHQEKMLSEVITKGVEGVRAIANNLTVVHRPRRDGDIEADIVRRWESDPWIDESLLGLIVEKGDVSLTGTVGSLDERRRAVRDAWVDGVRRVDAAALEVRWWARNRMRRSPVGQRRTDEQVREALELALKYDPRTTSSAIEVTVSDRKVALSGTVKSLDAKKAAEVDAENITGVRRVLNHIKVSEVSLPTNPPDSNVRRRVRRALLEDPYLQDASTIDVQFNAGTVSLSGTVHSLFDKVRAENITARMSGVLDVKNNLRALSPLAERRDALIHRRIQEAIKWNPYLYDKHISIGVEDGQATLTGTVRSLAEVRLATEKAYQGGALGVRNHLDVIGKQVPQAKESVEK